MEDEVIFIHKIVRKYKLLMFPFVIAKTQPKLESSTFVFRVISYLVVLDRSVHESDCVEFKQNQNSNHIEVPFDPAYFPLFFFSLKIVKKEKIVFDLIFFIFYFFTLFL